jgi:CheY-like chemotaxis protein
MDKVVLVVDDSTTVRKFVAASLNMKGFRVVTAADGVEALERMPAEIRSYYHRSKYARYGWI